MKKSLLLLAAMSLATGLVAQLDIGGKAGVNLHFQNTTLGDRALSGAVAPEGTSGPGFHVGAFLQLDISDMLYLRPEVLFSTRYTTAKLNSDIAMGGTRTVIDQETKGSLAYTEVPLLLGVRLSEKFSIHAGPGFGLLMNSSSKVRGTRTVTTPEGTSSTSLDTSVSSTEGLRPLEIAGVIGLGYRMSSGLDLGVRYWSGLNTLEETTDFSKTKQRVVQISIGYAFVRG